MKKLCKNLIKKNDADWSNSSPPDSKSGRLGAAPRSAASKEDINMTQEEKKLVCSIIDSGSSFSKIKATVNAIPNTESTQKVGSWQELNCVDALDKEGNLYLFHNMKCSSCNARLLLFNYDNYCPRCGSNNSFK